jgi:hypothetical protein
MGADTSHYPNVDDSARLHSLCHVEALLEQPDTQAAYEAISALGQILVPVQPFALEAIRTWSQLLIHHDPAVRREAYQQMEDAVDAGYIPEELGDLLEGLSS